MNEQATMMNQQQQQQQLMNMNQSLMSRNQMNPHLPQQPQVTKFNKNKPFAHRPPIPQPSNLINSRPQMVQMNRSYGGGMWAAQPQQFQNPNINPGPVKIKPQQSAFNKSLAPRSNWKGKRVGKPNDKRRSDQQKSLYSSGGIGIGIGGVNVTAGGGNLNFNNYNPPTLNELQHQNRLKTRKYFQKKKFNKNNSMSVNMSGGNFGRSAPFAPRNTTSFLIRAKKSGGIAPLVSPNPATPAVLPTPVLSPSTEVLGDMAKEEWGVDGYGSMKGLIRLRSPGHEMEIQEDEEEDEGGSSESDVEEHVEMERRLDHDLSRFEMIDPNSLNVNGVEFHNVLENRVDDQDTHIAQLEEENLILKERLFLMERELGDLRRRLLSLERRGNREENINEEVVENESEDESRSHGEETHSIEDNNEDSNGENNPGDTFVNRKGNDGGITDGFEAAETTEKIARLHVEGKLENEDDVTNVADKTNNITDEKGKEENMNNTDESIKPYKADEKIAGMTANNDDNKYVDTKVETEDDVNADSYKHVVEGDVCILEGDIAKDNMVLEEDVGN